MSRAFLLMTVLFCVTNVLTFSQSMVSSSLRNLSASMVPISWRSLSSEASFLMMPVTSLTRCMKLLNSSLAISCVAILQV